jgi:hypothetical protein
MFVVGVVILRMLGVAVMNARFGKEVCPVRSCFLGCGRTLEVGKSGDVGFLLRTR